MEKKEVAYSVLPLMTCSSLIYCQMSKWNNFHAVTLSLLSRALLESSMQVEAQAEPPGGLVGFTLLILLGRITQICLWSDSQRLGTRYILYLLHEFYMFKGFVFITAIFLSFLNTLLTVLEALILLTSHNFKATTQQFDLCNYTICTNYSFSNLKV